jgi:hypothetical protein
MTLNLPQTTALTPSPSSRNDASESGSNMETEQEQVTSLGSVSKQGPAKSISAENISGIGDSATAANIDRTHETGKESQEKNQKNEKPAEEDSNAAMTEKDMDAPTEYEDERRLRDMRFWITPPAPLDERQKKSRLRLTQSVHYTELVEDRILELEKKVRRALREKTPVDEDENSSKLVPGSNNCFSVLRWADFSARIEVDPKQIAATRWKHRPEMDDERKSVIELLLEEPRLSLALLWKNNQSDSGTQLPLQVTGLLKGQTAQPVALEPHRIRIRSQSLLKVLKGITGCETTIGPHRHRLLLLRPFKLLVAFADKLQKHHEGMERVHAMSSLGMSPRLLFHDRLV